MTSMGEYDPKEVFAQEDTLSHYTELGHQRIATTYQKAITDTLNAFKKTPCLQKVSFSQDNKHDNHHSGKKDESGFTPLSSFRLTKESANTKKIIHTWIQLFRDTNTFFMGLGDLIQGAIGLYTLSNLLNVHFDIDYSLHPAKRLLAYSSPDKIRLPFLHRNKLSFEFLPNRAGALDFIRESLSCKNTLRFCTNMYQDTINDISPTCKTFIRNSLTPCDSLLKSVNDACPPRPFSVLLFGTEEQIPKDVADSLAINRLIDKIKDVYEPSDFLITDCELLKKEAVEHGINTLQTSFPQPKRANNYHLARNALFNFFVTTRASKIKTSSAYPVASGTMAIVSKIFDIPIKKC
jgi:hypothetical protein